MDKPIYKLTDVMTIIKKDKTLFEPDLKRISQRKRKELSKPIDKQTEKDITDDFEGEDLLVLKNISVEVYTRIIKRYQSIVNEVKVKREFKCQICGESFEKEKGEPYCEAHHIVPLSLDGSQDPKNVVVLCANHHRMFHYAKKEIVEELMEKVLSIS